MDEACEARRLDEVCLAGNSWLDWTSAGAYDLDATKLRMGINPA